ncbi:MAG TPA: hypothetical protein VJ803_04895 [Gemmatimonadaceae bacterium]|nr:hypothetical protein [Gemmatimonadaceae bacterium]
MTGRGTRDAGREGPKARRPWLARSALVLVLLRVTPLAGQQVALRLEPEVRVDAFLADRSALHGALGVSIPLANTVRAQVIAGLGALIGGGDGTSGRVDLLARYLVDPFRRARWGFYGGGGVSARYDEGQDWHGELVVLVGAERRSSGRLMPFFELGYGGGVKLGVGLRSSPR